MLKATQFISTLVFLLMLLEIAGAALTAFPHEADYELSFHTRKSSASVFEAFLFEKAEEETEKSEEEKNGSHRILLVDFSRVAQLLSIKFVPKIRLASFASHYDVGPPAYTLHCVFII